MVNEMHKQQRPIARIGRAMWLLALPVVLQATSVANAESDDCVTSDLPSLESVQSLEKVFDEVARRGDGEIIRADLTSQGIGDLCIWVYKIKLLSGSGDVTNVVYDAAALRMIGYGAPSALVEKPRPRSGLRGIGQRFGFFGRRDPSSEGRGDSNRGDGVAASSGDGSATADGTDSAAPGDNADNANDGGSATADNGNSNDTGGAANGDDSRGGGDDAGTGDGGSQSAPKDRPRDANRRVIPCVF